ncbi:MAG: hypothetical protein OXF74_09905 [Rhodobacteraceae bacterium]|nr:hypothetical protein [Paracoccaceae bacterium]
MSHRIPHLIKEYEIRHWLLVAEAVLRGSLRGIIAICHTAYVRRQHLRHCPEARTGNPSRPPGTLRNSRPLSEY